MADIRIITWAVETSNDLQPLEIIELLLDRLRFLVSCKAADRVKKKKRKKNPFTCIRDNLLNVVDGDLRKWKTDIKKTEKEGTGTLNTESSILIGRFKVKFGKGKDPANIWEREKKMELRPAASDWVFA